MAAKTGSGCVEPAQGVLGNSPEAPPVAGAPSPSPPPVIRARVGQPAPDFDTTAFVYGGFKNIRLSDYRGKWVILCFYPGDFTFV